MREISSALHLVEQRQAQQAFTELISLQRVVSLSSRYRSVTVAVLVELCDAHVLVGYNRPNCVAPQAGQPHSGLS